MRAMQFAGRQTLLPHKPIATTLTVSILQKIAFLCLFKSFLLYSDKIFNLSPILYFFLALNDKLEIL
jgi:hypothetical protein